MIPLADLPYIEWTDATTGATRRIYADVVKSESPNLPAVVTKHAVEKGASITDHYRKENETVSVTYFFSGSPIRGDLDEDFPGEVQPKELRYPPNQSSGASLLTPGGLTQAATGAISGLLGLGPPPLPKKMDVLAFSAAPKRLEKTLEQIRELQRTATLVTVRTTVGRFEDCAILNAKLERAPEHGDGGDIVLELEQVTFATSDLALALPLPAEPRAIPKKNAAAAGADAASGGAKSSVLKNLLNGAGVTSAGSGL